jgi:hypothetical protein
LLNRLPRLAFALGLLLLDASCERGPDASGPPVRVQAGVFFGGQLQQRTKWSLVIDPARQTQGFRIRFQPALLRSAELSWELTRPRLDHKRRVVATKSNYTATLPAGTEHNDQLIQVDESDRPGKWKLAVSLDGKSVYEGAIDVVPHAATAGDD